LDKNKAIKMNRENLKNMYNSIKCKINKEDMIMKFKKWEKIKIKKWKNIINKNIHRCKIKDSKLINFLQELLNKLRNINKRFLSFKILNIWAKHKILAIENHQESEKLMLKINLKINFQSQWLIEILKT
jgi:hypothetical protein